MGNPKIQYKTALAKKLNAKVNQISLFWKGRVGLYAILKAMGIGEGDEVIIPAFTCVVVPNAIIYLGAKPVYVDIDPSTYNIDCSKIEATITASTKVIIAQNTFGLSSDFDQINAIAQKHHLEVIEDCTHGFGGFYKGKANGTCAKAAFYSSQWNKPFSTGIGGMVLCQDADLAEKLRAIEKDLLAPSFKEVQMLALQLKVRPLLNPTLYWTAIKTFRLLSKYNLVTGSSSGEELEAPILPKDFLKRLSTTQANKGLEALAIFEKNILHRRKIANLYTVAFAEMGFIFLTEPDYATHTIIKYPFLVKDRKAFLALAETNNIQLNDWFLSPIHPIEVEFEQWHYRYGDFPIAEKISQHILNLPTDLSISIKEAQRIIQFLKKHQAHLVSLKGGNNKQ